MTTHVENNAITSIFREAVKQTYTFNLTDGSSVRLERNSLQILDTAVVTVAPKPLTPNEKKNPKDNHSFTLDLPPAYETDESWKHDVRAACLRTLLLDRALLSHGTWLVDTQQVPEDLTVDEKSLLVALGETLGARLGFRTNKGNAECGSCYRERIARHRIEVETIDQTIRDLVRKGANNATPELRTLSQRVSSLRSTGPQRPTQMCAHVSVMTGVPSVLLAKQPAVAFELAGLLKVDTDAVRFVLGNVFESVLLPQWLTGRTRQGYSYYYYGYTSRTRSPRNPSMTSIRNRANAAKQLPEEHRAGVTYATIVWGITASPDAYGWTPSQEPIAAATLRYDIDEAPLDVAVQVPPFAVKRAAPKASPQPEKPAEKGVTEKKATAKKVTATVVEEKKVAAKKSTAKSVTVKKSTAKSVTAKKMTSLEAVSGEVLRAMGIPNVQLQVMLQDGTLVEVGDNLYTYNAEIKKPQR
jgi:hypothetical protein